MLTKDLFIKQIELELKFNKELDKLENILGCSLIECKLVNMHYDTFDGFLESNFTETGSDLIYWWMYEEVPKEIFINDADDKIDVEDLSDLWDYMCKDKETFFL